MDALAPRAEEGRGKTAKSLGKLSSKHSRGFPNGETCLDKVEITIAELLGYGR